MDQLNNSLIVLVDKQHVEIHEIVLTIDHNLSKKHITVVQMGMEICYASNSKT
jgi:hypothetical protein